MDLTEWLNAKRGRAAYLSDWLGVPESLVSQWRSGIRKIPADRCPDIERATDGAVRCEAIRPDIDWRYLRRKDA